MSEVPEHLQSWYALARSRAQVDVDLAPGEYRQVPSTYQNGHLIWAVVRCPACRELCCVGRGPHTVDASGYIHPLFRCGHANCTFHRWLLLEDWRPEPQGSA